MEGSPQSSLSEEDSSSKERSLPEEENDLQSEQVEDVAHEESLLSGEEQLTLITESMSITSSDEEKLQLLNKNTELRRLNKENKGEYYEQTLMQELKKNQHLQEYIRLLESRLHQTDLHQWTRGTQTPDMSGTSDSRLLQRSSKPSLDVRSTVSPGTKSSLRLAVMGMEIQSDPVREVQDLKEQLEALRCQTKIYEADYKTEQKDHERMLQENKRLRRREADMRQQMALLQEQLKVYEDDFHKERSDKQILQRLLMKKSPAEKDPVLVHRCNNEQDRPRTDRRKSRGDQRGGYVCPKHCEHHGQPDFH
ncbi:spindle assembly checkpoint component mad1 isoform X2 [Pimephales promelas]|uniref:spindle assembly checkpoint component mad1 isoform X2 n=1 Tax=Pimephales promelas TaxID=90988 RepID=UPI0019556807|nr:spindle assembly checkpoint component mad1 isoform X2 [Pimephales promelas]